MSRTIRIAAVLLSGWAALPVLAAPTADERRHAEEQRKAHEAAVRKVLDTFRTESRAKEENDRITAVNKLAEVQDRRILDTLSRVITGRDTDAVKIQAIRQVGTYVEDKNAVRVLSTAMNANKKRKPVLAAAAIEALGDIDAHSAIPSILRLYRDKDTVIVRAALLASAKIRDRACVDPLLKLLRELEEELPAAVGGAGVVDPVREAMAKRKSELLEPTQRALSDITQQAFTSYKEWNDWWRKNRRTFRTDPDSKRR
jgi:HEAT repeat protein